MPNLNKPKEGKRLSKSKGAKVVEKRPELVSKLPKKGDIYVNFKDAVVRLCDDMMKQNIPEAQKARIAALKAKTIIEL